MCTLSWVPLPGGYALAMNRDEQLTRSAGTPPALREVNRIPVICPTDAAAGGSWIAANALGHSLALLNRFEDTPHDPAGAFVSRGLLLLELAGAPGPDSIGAALAGRALRPYRPFTLASLVPGSRPRLYEWSGQELTSSEVGEPGLLRASSGTAQAAAARERAAVFAQAAAQHGGFTAELLGELHRSHLPVRGAVSICVHRDDAKTVSFSLITVALDAVSFRQLEGSPCRSERVSELCLPRYREPRG
ncbi:MAG TPA: NRDE family protein [Gemmatimonadales bacterium]|nr:NRDE family protein [Gemmatimonadales bacterium]